MNSYLQAQLIAILRDAVSFNWTEVERVLATLDHGLLTLLERTGDRLARYANTAHRNLPLSERQHLLVFYSDNGKPGGCTFSGNERHILANEPFALFGACPQNQCQFCSTRSEPATSVHNVKG